MIIQESELQVITEQFKNDSLKNVTNIMFGGFTEPTSFSQQNQFVSEIVNCSNEKLYITDTNEEYEFPIIKIINKSNTIIFDYDVAKIKTPLFIKSLLYSCHEMLSDIINFPVKISIYTRENCPACVKMVDNLISYTLETGEGINIDILDVDKLKINILSVPFIIIKNLQTGKENSFVGMYNNSILRKNIIELMEE